jgi:hypothetical protein
MTSRDVGDISTNPGGRTGAEWTGGTRESLLALWEIAGGPLFNVAGTNVITADVYVEEGFTAYTDGLRCTFRPAATNTGAATINLSGIGAKAIRDPDGEVLSAGAIVEGRVTEIIFIEDDDHFRLVTSGGTTNVTVQGGIILQRSAPARAVSNSSSTTSLTAVVSQSFTCGQTNSRVIIEGNVGRLMSTGSADDDGVVIGLYVDGTLVDSFTDYALASSYVNTPFYFSRSPGDSSAHTYEIRVSSTISATYIKGATAMWCSEMSPNS